MRQFPLEIEADLLFQGIDVFDWHQGRMSSRRLLCLIDNLPQEGAYWRERRDGDWSMQEYMNATIVNELRLLRADQSAIHANHKMELHLVESPAQQKEAEDLSDRQREVRELILAQLKGKKN